MWRIVIAASLVLALSSSQALAEDYPGAKIVSVGKGNVVFEHGGKTHRVAVDVSLKIFDDRGQAQDPVTGTRFLAAGNIVDVKTKSPSARGTSGAARIAEIKFVKGTVAELPDLKPGDTINLKPDPKFSGNVFGGDGWSRDSRMVKYIPTAKVGDFVEFERNKDPGRREVIEVGPDHDYVIESQVTYDFGSRSEMRFKHRLPTAKEAPPKPEKPEKPAARPGPVAKNKKSSKKPAAEPPARPTTEEIEVAGQKLLCEIKYSDGEPRDWFSAEVPLDGLVRTETRNVKYRLTSFGRGK